jgi:hypothetical protein
MVSPHCGFTNGRNITESVMLRIMISDMKSPQDVLSTLVSIERLSISL